MVGEATLGETALDGNGWALFAAVEGATIAQEKMFPSCRGCV
jgi:hypothetical protein